MEKEIKGAQYDEVYRHHDCPVKVVGLIFETPVYSTSSEASSSLRVNSSFSTDVFSPSQSEQVLFGLLA